MNKLTKEIAIDAVKHIDQVKEDYEQAHCEEVNLCKWFIKCVSEDMYNYNELIQVAEIVKSTENIEFERYYA